METLLIALGAGIAFLVAYYTYGRWLGRKIFNVSASYVCPSHRLRDDKDYVPTGKGIVFGHHFTSIAGTGPIVGPAIAVMWGWLPALLWVIFGSIFIGAVHDFGSLVVSLRNNGQTVGDIAGRVLNKRTRLLFLFVLFLALTIVIAIFGLVIAGVFRMFPAAIFPCLVQIPLAIIIGLWLHRKGANLLIPSMLALGLMYLSVYYGNVGWLGDFNNTLANMQTITWVALLLAYSYVASVIPVWVLLQPRDYINSLQLISALALVVLGLGTAAFIGGAPPVEGGDRPELSIAAPMVQWTPEAAPLIFPFLFITVACGAISGFHCLVSSGTSSKQLDNEQHARFVGFGGMLTEGFLATLVILACVAGLGLGIDGQGGEVLTGSSAYASRYASWTAASGLPAKVGSFVDGAGNFLASMYLPRAFGVALMGVLVASFAATTLDTAVRLQRYVVQELAATALPAKPSQACIHCGYDLAGNVSGTCPECGWEIDPNRLAGDAKRPASMRQAATAGAVGFAAPLNGLAVLTNKHAATVFALIVGGVIAALPAPSADAWTWATAGSGGMILWPLFGATNQLLGGLAFLVIGFYLWRRSKPVWFVLPPLVFMLIMPAWALLWQMFIEAPGADTGWWQDQRWILFTVGLATLALELWMIVEAVLLWPNVRGVLEDQLKGAEADPALQPAPA
jgi:carbon starvation protein